MPRVRRRGHVKRAELTFHQALDLCLGRSLRAFASDDDRLRAWREHREHLVTNPLSRPAAWWDYEAPERRRPRAEESETAQLARLGLLTDFEKSILDRKGKS